MLKGFFDGVPRELDEAALTDGCTRLGSLYRVVLPAAVPGVVAAGTFGFMSGWNEFFFAEHVPEHRDEVGRDRGARRRTWGKYFVEWSALMATACRDLGRTRGAVSADPTVYDGGHHAGRGEDVTARTAGGESRWSER